jgi:hypothetical protein
MAKPTAEARNAGTGANSLASMAATITAATAVRKAAFRFGDEDFEPCATSRT